MKKILLLILLSTISWAQFPTNGLLAQYGFDNGSLIDGANGINFTQTGSSLQVVEDRFHTASNAIQLNGDFLTRTDVNYSSTYDDYSISFWVKTPTNSSDTKTIFYDFGGTFPVGYHIFLKDGKITLTQTSAFGSSYVTTSAQSNYIADNNWHNIVAILDQCAAKIYVDGQLLATGPNNNPNLYLNRLVDSVGSFMVSNNRNGNLSASNKYTDILDDILIYNRVLSNSEINGIITYNNYCFAPSNTLLSISGLTENNATLTLNTSNSGTFEYVLVEKGQPISSGQILVINNGVPVSLSGLLKSTSYEVFLRKDCTSNSNTDWSSAFNFRTKGTVYVNANASGDNTGSNWGNAFTSLQNALSVINANDEIWIASGTYNPSTSDRNSSFNIQKSNLRIYGGFAGTETNINQRNFSLNNTILSGDLLGNDNTILDFVNTTRDDNSYNIVLINANDIVLDGLTIANGHANGSVIEKKLGAAIYKTPTTTNLDIKNCVLKNNVSLEGASAIFSRYSTNGNLKIHNCNFNNNVSRYGTSIYSYTDNNFTANIEIVNSLFFNNVAKDNSTALGYAGSAGWFRAYGTSSTMNVTLVNNTYANNIDTGSTSGLNNFNRATIGLGYTNGTLNATVANNIFWGNTATGGAVAKSLAQIVDNLGQNITVKNSTAQDNFSNIPSGGVSNVLNTDPMFTNAGSDDFTLSNGSTAIDNGDNTNVVGTTDLLGNIRIFNGTVDRGAYEYGSTLTNDSFTTNNEFKMYPNPVQNVLTIESNSDIENIEIYSLEGKLVLKSNQKQIDVQSLVSGIYLLKINSMNGEVIYKKIMKK
ncbi:T9SS type A sorting domain-containing protein [Flavobacterium okayamense]|uniref:Secretion system C-terminal sorting domain-containing protein n=1 Tax=Flavobacterium okayamense TaxID=2830782 RepID=A0ABN6HZ57_9FLAO|nr:T9SS type A sorting domain-containing protein [Flavobacterium okayamense]BCY27518.1 hypothetical protein KK2020170_03860 [Flavobacterium okayamense]